MSTSLMTSTLPTLTDPDKLGLLLQCRQKMDELNPTNLYKYADFSLKLLSTKQLKSVIFVGLNAIKNNISYNQLFKMKSSINEIIEQAKKLKNKSKPNAKQLENKSITIPIIAKNASLTKTIPFDIISNNICHFLKMSSITKLAQCDRKLAIICHTPTSINNLMHRYDIYKYNKLPEDDYMLDGHYDTINNCDLSNIHRFKNIEKLAIDLQYLNTAHKIPIFNSFRRVKHLSIHDMEENAHYPSAMTTIQTMPSLQTISFINTDQFDNLIHFLKQYKNTNNNITSYYNQIIYQLKSIQFIDCDGSFAFEGDEKCPEYDNIVNFILPTQPNHLQVLKFENSNLGKNNHVECKNANDEFENVNRIKTSLANLKGFVYDEPSNDDDDNLFLGLSRNILSNLISFKYLKSIHTHSSNNQLLPIYLNNNNTNALNRINELCISILMNGNSKLLLNTIKQLMPNLEKLCVVINILDKHKSKTSKFEKIIELILTIKTLKLFQIVTIFDDADDINQESKFCTKKMKVLTEFTKILVKLFKQERSYHSKRPLLFKFHLKSSHDTSEPKCSTYGSSSLQAFADSIQNMTVHYLMTFPLGKIQFKYSRNVDEHRYVRLALKNAMKGSEILFRVFTKIGGSLKHLDDDKDGYGISTTDMDFKQYAISITQNNIVDKCVEYVNNWEVDCRYCCNTPWV